MHKTQGIKCPQSGLTLISTYGQHKTWQRSRLHCLIRQVAGLKQATQAVKTAEIAQFLYLTPF